MQSIFNKANNLVLIEMVKKLSPETQALWGKMSISQMLAHVYQPLLVMKGDKKIKFTLLGILVGKRLKKKNCKKGDLARIYLRILNLEFLIQNNFIWSSKN